MKPLTHGNILIVGAKASNMPTDVRENPRVFVWDSQDKWWNGKEVPVNTQAIFFTRWVSHPEYDDVMKQARKKNILVFTKNGTGMITKQVKELLNMNNRTPVDSVSTNHIVTVPVTTMPNKNSKLHPLIEFIDTKQSAYRNADILLAKAKELGISTTRDSLAVFVSRVRRKTEGSSTVIIPRKSRFHREKTADVTVEIFDNIIKELSDMRQFLISTVEENRALRTRIERFKNYLTNGVEE